MRSFSADDSLLAFVVTIIFVLIVSVVVMYIFNSIVVSRVDSLNKESFEEISYRRYNKYRNLINLLIVGDSHPGEALVDDLLPNNWLKATHPGEDISLSRIKTSFFVKNSDKIQYLIVPLDYHSLNGSWGVSRQEYDIYNDNFGSRILLTNKMWDDYNRKLLVLSIVKKINNIAFHINPDSTVASEVVNHAPPLSYADRVTQRVENMLHQPVIDPESERVFNEIYLLAKSRQIKLIGVRFPLPNEYIKVAESSKLNKMDKWIIDHKMQFYKVYDFRRIYSSDQSKFVNEDHISYLTAHEFTKMFVQTLSTDLKVPSERSIRTSTGR